MNRGNCYAHLFRPVSVPTMRPDSMSESGLKYMFKTFTAFGVLEVLFFRLCDWRVAFFLIFLGLVVRIAWPNNLVLLFPEGSLKEQLSF